MQNKSITFSFPRRNDVFFHSTNIHSGIRNHELLLQEVPTTVGVRRQASIFFFRLKGKKSLQPASI